MHSPGLLSFLPVLLPLVSALTPHRSPLTDCFNAAHIPFILSSSPNWTQVITPVNVRFVPTPNVVAQPRTVQEVQSAVKCANKLKVKLTVKGGGHSYGAFGHAGSLILDMIRFQEVTVDRRTQNAKVGGGLRLGNMATKLFNQGERALPHGTCPSVGVGGHATLGGFGVDSRMWGLLVDRLYQLDVVLANGTATSVSVTQHPDLFWALRGAGPGFAVVHTFHFKTLPAPPVNINWIYMYTFTDATTAAEAFHFATQWGLENAPKETGYGIILGPGGAFLLQGVYYGSQAVFEALIAPLLKRMKVFNGGVDPMISVQPLGWIASLEALGGSALTMPPEGDGTHNAFYVKSLETYQEHPLSLDSIKSLFTYIYNTPPPNGNPWFINNILYGGLNSTITSYPPSTAPGSTSSYNGRDTGYVWQVYGYTASMLPPWDPAIVPFIEGIVEALGPEAADLPAYAPYVDTQLSREEAQARYWGDGVPRLRRIKKEVDPTGVLYNPQGF